MQRASDIANKINIKTTSTDSKHYDQVLDKERLKRIFAIMQATYTSLWVNSYPTKELLDIAFNVWGKKLYGLTDMQIKNGLDNLPEGPYPPDPVKFRNICIGHVSGLTHNTAVFRNNYTENKRNQKLIEKKPDKQKAKEALNKIRGIIQD